MEGKRGRDPASPSLNLLEPQKAATWRSDHGLSEAGLRRGLELNNGAEVEKVKSTERHKSLPQIQHHLLTASQVAVFPSESLKISTNTPPPEDELEVIITSYLDILLYCVSVCSVVCDSLRPHGL